MMNLNPYASALLSKDISTFMHIVGEWDRIKLT